MRTLDHLTIGISTSALFDMRIPEQIFRERGVEGYRKYMSRTKSTLLKPGPAFAAIHTLSNIFKNSHTPLPFSFALVSKNDMATSERAMKSCHEYGIMHPSAVFSGGRPHIHYLKTHDVGMFITDKQDDADAAMRQGVAAMSINGPLESFDTIQSRNMTKLHLAWDLDRVLFGSEADIKFGELGYHGYVDSELEQSSVPLSKGPFADICRFFGDLAKQFDEPDKTGTPFINSVVTARGQKASMRAMQSLTTLGIYMNGEAHFCGSQRVVDGKLNGWIAGKGPVLAACQDAHPDECILFMDDSSANTESAVKSGVAAGLVPRCEPGGGLNG